MKKKKSKELFKIAKVGDTVQIGEGKYKIVQQGSKDKPYILTRKK